jgi:hypothetical protein
MNPGGRVSKVEMTTFMALICKVLFPSISTFETPPCGVAHNALRPAGSDKPLYVAHGLALLNEIRTWGVVREGRCSKKGLFFPDSIGFSGKITKY